MLALGFEMLVTTGVVTGGVVTVVVVEDGVLMVVVVDDEFVGMVELVGVVVVVVGVEFLDGCLDFRDAAEMFVESFAVVGV
jgi:hypothetical protein